MLLDCRHPYFRNFDSIISIDVIRMKLYVDGLFNPTSVPVWVTVNKLNLVLIWKVPGLVSAFQNHVGLGMSMLHVSVVFFYPPTHL